ncbi:MAG TPA: glycosyltransferase family 4 protein [Terriglobales bacterium]
MKRVLYLATSGQVGGAERCLLSCAAGLRRSGEFLPEVLAGSRGPLFDLLAEAGVGAHLLPLPAALRRASRFHPLRSVAARTAALTGAGPRSATPSDPLTLSRPGTPESPGRLGPRLFAFRGRAAVPSFAAFSRRLCPQCKRRDPRVMWQAPLYARRLRRALAALQPAVLHSNGLKMHLLAAMAGAAPPLIWHLHDFPLPDAASVSNRLLQHFAPRTAMAVANSQAVAAAYAERVPALAGKLRVIANGIAPESMAGGDGEEFRRRWNLPADAFVFGMTAILAPWKGHEVFLEAARTVHDALPGARFLIVGDDVYDTHGHGHRRALLEARARDLGLADSVRFTGYLRDGLAAAYAACDVAVHASTLPEPFGRTAIEAMAAGVPLIAAAAGGLLEIVEPEQSGLLTPPGDAAALGAAMLRLAREPELRAHLIAGGRARVRERFAEDAINAQWMDLYREIIG